MSEEAREAREQPVTNLEVPTEPEKLAEFETAKAAAEHSGAIGFRTFRFSTNFDADQDPKLAKGEEVVFEWPSYEDDMKGAEDSDRSASTNTMLIAKFPVTE